MSDFQFQDENSIKAVFNMEVGREMNDHNKLYNKSLPNQHPMSAITDLETTISNIGLDILAEENRAKGIEGELSNLTTDSKANLVSAINEVDSHADNNATNLSNHINNKSNPHKVSKEQVGLGNCDNTADMDKPVSTATQTALTNITNGTTSIAYDNTTSGLSATTLQGAIDEIDSDLDDVEDLIPSAASSSNQLADKSYVDSADSGLQSQITANAGDIDTIEGKIPTQASTSNKLADKNFVNSSISTNTANFIGTFNSLAELEAYSGTITNNDYAFVVGTDSAGNTVYNRYKYTTATNPASWQFEYALNNSSFTANQWAAINSGATSTNIGQIATNTSAISGLSTSKQDKITATNKLASDFVDDSGQTNKFVTASEKAQITTNANNITDLQTNKADVDLSNITDSGKLVIGAEIGNRERKDISNLVANGTLSQAVAEQNLEKYGIHIGDYFTGASGYTYTVADMDTFYGGYNNNAIVNTHHVCLVVDTKHNEPWNYSTTITANNITFTYDSAGTGYYAWKNGEDYVYTSMRQPNPNSDKAYSDTTLTTEYATITAVNNFTDGGYVASNLHSYLTGTALPNVQSDLGTSHLVKHGKIYSNAMTANRYNRTGQNNGASSNWAWSSDQYISALTEAQMYGTIIWSSSGNDTGEAFKQLEVFRKFRANQIFGNTGVWLRDVVSSSSSANLHSGGSAHINNARGSNRVVGLIMFY